MMGDSMFQQIVKESFDVEGISATDDSDLGKLNKLKEEKKDLETEGNTHRNKINTIKDIVSLLTSSYTILDDNTGSLSGATRDKIFNNVILIGKKIQEVKSVFEDKIDSEALTSIQSNLNAAFDDLNEKTIYESVSGSKESQNISHLLKMIHFDLDGDDIDIKSSKINEVIDELENLSKIKVKEKLGEVHTLNKRIEDLEKNLEDFHIAFNEIINNKEIKKNFKKGVKATKNHNKFRGELDIDNVKELQIGEFGFETSRSLDGLDVYSSPGGMACIGAFRISETKIVFIAHKDQKELYEGDINIKKRNKGKKNVYYTIKTIPLSDH